MTTLVLTALAVLLAGPVPALIARFPRLRCTPLATMVLWQALALAAVLSALGAGLSLVTWSGLGRGGSPLRYVVAGAAALLTLTVIGRLLLSGHLVGTDLRRIRRRHRELVDLLGERPVGASDEQFGGNQDVLRVLENDTPAAWCLPGFHSRVVLSRATLDVLDQDALRAVLRHEHSHLRSRHDLVIEAFTVLHRAFPFSSARALTEVSLLVEVLADKAAVRETGPRPLMVALSHLVGASAPDATLAAASGGVLARLDVLRDPRPHRWQTSMLLLASGALLVLPTLLVALPWLQSLR